MNTQKDIWQWEHYLSELGPEASAQWQGFDWQSAAEQYRHQIREHHGYTRLFGKATPVSLERMFTDVFVLEKPRALLQLDIEQLNQNPQQSQDERIPGVDILKSDKGHRLFVLGKPGAGKTTFLSYVAVEAAKNNIPKVPIFVPVKTWWDSGLSLQTYINQQFKNCGLIRSQDFLEILLNTKDALVLFDGLDEVNQAHDHRQYATAEILAFSERYPNTQCAITCRLAATDYTFDTFNHVEIADFDDQQILAFVKNWFRDDPQKHLAFAEAFSRPANRGLRDLARTPLLLTLLCLAFEDNLAFPQRRVDIYIDALDALLRKWDTSRNIRRDDIYRTLSPIRKHQLFARIAAETFEKGAYFFPQSELEAMITGYMQNLPSADRASDKRPNGTAILRAIEAQHGILVERAQQIYTFAHLTFQEYYTARHTVSNAARGALKHLLYDHATSSRWHEVILLTASLLDDADIFFEIFLEALANLIQHDKTLITFFGWAKRKAHSVIHYYHQAALRSFYCHLALMHLLDHTITQSLALIRSRALDRALALDLDFARALALNDIPECIIDLDLSRTLTLAHTLAQARDRERSNERTYELLRRFGHAIKLSQRSGLSELYQALARLSVPNANMPPDAWHDFFHKLQRLMLLHRDIGQDWDFTPAQAQRLSDYFYSNELLINCLDLAYVSDRKAIEDRLFLPPQT